MDIRNKLYPYPVLQAGSDDYVKSKFDFDMELTRDGQYFLLQADFRLTNKKIAELIAQEKAEYVLRIECPATFYRTILRFSEQSDSVRIPAGYLGGKMSVSSFIVVRCELKNYRNYDFNIDYSNIGFDLDKGNLLAIGPKQNVEIGREKDELVQMPSIFTMYRIETTEDIGFEPELYSDKIRIGMNIAIYEKYSVFANSSLRDEVNLPMLLPTLVYVFDEMKYAGIEEFENYKWFVSLRSALKMYSMTLSNDLLEEKSSIFLAQKILGMPLGKALDSIKKAIEPSEED